MKTNTVSEPFLINPPKKFKKGKRVYRRRNPTLMIINKPKRKVIRRKIKRVIKRIKTKLIKAATPRRRTEMRRRKGSHRLSVLGRRGHLRVSRRSRLAPLFGRRGSVINPFSGLDLADNPRRRRRFGRRNPILAIPKSIPLVGIDTAEIVPEVLGAIGGFVVVKSLPQIVFPLDWQTGYKKYISELATLIAVTMVANRVVGRRVGKMVFYGGLIAIGSSLVGQLLVKVGLPVSMVEGFGYYMTDKTKMGYYLNPEEE